LSGNSSPRLPGKRGQNIVHLKTFLGLVRGLVSGLGEQKQALIVDAVEGAGPSGGGLGLMNLEKQKTNCFFLFCLKHGGLWGGQFWAGRGDFPQHRCWGQKKQPSVVGAPNRKGIKKGGPPPAPVFVRTERGGAGYGLACIVPALDHRSSKRWARLGPEISGGADFGNFHWGQDKKSYIGGKKPQEGGGWGGVEGGHRATPRPKKLLCV